MKKKPLFDVSHFNRIADKHDIPWIDRIPLIEIICWGSKGWIDPELTRKMDVGGVYAAFLDEIKANESWFNGPVALRVYDGIGTF